LPLPRGRDLEKTRRQLADWLRARLPAAGDLAVSPLSGPAATGFSNDTLLFDVAWVEDGRQKTLPLVCRIEPTGFGVFPRYDVAQQFRVMDALHGTPVPVPRMHWLETDPSLLGAPFFVMERVEGRIPSDNPTYHMDGWMKACATDERAAIWTSGLDALAAIHRCDPDALGIDFLDAPPPATDTVGWQLDAWRRYFEWVAGDRRFPTHEAAWEWLQAHRPPASSRAGLCWGDARIGNQIFRDGRCVAVLDWEMATRGPAEMDLGWFLYMDRHHSEGVGAPRLEGLPDRSASVARWERAVGRTAESIPFWEAFAAWRFATIMIRLGDQLIATDLIPADSTFPADNTASRLLARVIDLPPPGENGRS
jgi:aminoglycoside phosphotransferase (APT) family kinase protein